MADPNAGVPSTSGNRPNLVRVRPKAPGARPWAGIIVDMTRSPLAANLSFSDAKFYRVVRCVDACDAVGLCRGAEYLVRADFIEY